MPKFKLKLISPERTLFEEEAEEIIVPTTSGEITVLAGHEPLVAQLSHGDLIIKDGKKERVVIVFGGFLHIEPNSVIVLADSAEHIDEIDNLSVEKAIAAAKKAAQEKVGTIPDTEIGEENLMLAETQAELLKNLTRLKVLHKHRSHHGVKYDD